MPPRRAVRPTGPAVIAAVAAVEPAIDDPDQITTSDVIEALGNLRTKSEAEYQEWQRLAGMNYIGPAKDAKTVWESTLHHIDKHLHLWELLEFDRKLAE